MSTDPMLGGTVTQISVGKGGVVDFKPSQLGEVQQTVDEYGRLINSAPQRPGQAKPVGPNPNEVRPDTRPQINRKMVVVGYKGKAEAWIKSFDKLYKARGGQTDRHFFLAFDPRDEELRGPLMEAGARTFEKFVLVPYRYNLPQNRLGLPAPKNLDALMGVVQEEYFNGGPALMAIPFHTLHGTPFDQIENHYKMSKMPFLGYEVRKTVQGNKTRMPGAIVVFPPGWATHPLYVLKKGLSAAGGTDLYFMRDEILRDMRTCEQICGSGQQPSSFACVQGFDTDEAFGPETLVDPNARPAGAKAVGVPLEKGALIVTDGLDRVVRQPESKVPVVTFTKPELIAAIKATGFKALNAEQKKAYSEYVSVDDDFYEEADKANHAQKISAGKAKKKLATSSK